MTYLRVGMVCILCMSMYECVCVCVCVCILNVSIVFLRWVVRSILHGEPIELFLVPASTP